jgi:hypothetical protein
MDEMKGSVGVVEAVVEDHCAAAQEVRWELEAVGRTEGHALVENLVLGDQNIQAGEDRMVRILGQVQTLQEAGHILLQTDQEGSIRQIEGEEGSREGRNGLVKDRQVVDLVEKHSRDITQGQPRAS